MFLLKKITITVDISIHALLAESDNCSFRLSRCSCYFYPRSPCGERPTAFSMYGALPAFLSTLSLRRATVRTFIPFRQCWNFYPRSPCGERRGYGQYYIRAQEISIHALLAESDRKITITVDEGTLISIHALLAESDRINRNIANRERQFLSTLSLRRATLSFSAI